MHGSVVEEISEALRQGDEELARKLLRDSEPAMSGNQKKRIRELLDAHRGVAV